MYRLCASLMMTIMLGAGLWVMQTTTGAQQVFAEEMKGHEHEQMSAQALKVRKPTSEEIGQMKICAVQGTKFEVASNTPVIDYKGKPYYFCCEHCLQDFQKDPDKYAK